MGGQGGNGKNERGEKPKCAICRGHCAASQAMLAQASDATMYILLACAACLRPS